MVSVDRVEITYDTACFWSVLVHLRQMSIDTLCTYLCRCLFVCVGVCLFVSVSVCLCLCLLVYESVCLFVSVPVSVSV